ncbi:MAG: hypothetical protein ACLUFI_10740 [Oscillospiraceae bacterium]
MMLRSEDKREFLEALGPADDFLLVDGYNIIFAWDELRSSPIPASIPRGTCS